MKKLSIEEKAKAYDEALERVVNIRTGKCETTFIFTEGLFDYLFPELEECNEEEVREAMIDFFKHEREEGVVVSHYGVNIERMIAWLEKQGNPTDINPSEFDLRINKLLKQFETLPKEELASSLSFYLNVVQNDGTYREEKQGEQNPIMAKSPQLGGQKSANNNEPKFHEKDWSIDDYLWQITAKEQLDVLYTKIKEAGYEWDDEKKEFKKIKNPAWSEEDEKAINDIMWIIEAYRKDGFNETHIQMADNSEKWLKSLKQRIKL